MNNNYKDSATLLLNISDNILQIDSYVNNINVFVNDTCYIKESSDKEFELNLTKGHYSIAVTASDSNNNIVSNSIEYNSNIIVLSVNNESGLKALTLNKNCSSNIKFIVDNSLLKDAYKSKLPQIIIPQNK